MIIHHGTRGSAAAVFQCAKAGSRSASGRAIPAPLRRRGFVVSETLFADPFCADRVRGGRVRLGRAMIRLGSRNLEWTVAASFALVSLSGVPAAAFPFGDYNGGYGGGGYNGGYTGGFGVYPSNRNQGGYYVRERPRKSEEHAPAPHSARHRLGGGGFRRTEGAAAKAFRAADRRGFDRQPARDRV